MTSLMLMFLLKHNPNVNVITLYCNLKPSKSIIKVLLKYLQRKIMVTLCDSDEGEGEGWGAAMLTLYFTVYNAKISLLHHVFGKSYISGKLTIAKLII